MAYYSKNGNFPEPLPNRIVLPDGTTRTDNTTFTEDEILAVGYKLAPNMPSVPYPNKVEWTGTNWLVREPNDQEIQERWQWIHEECDRRLYETDYKVIKAIEQNIPLDSVYTEYRQALRDLYNNVNNINPWDFQFPTVEQFMPPEDSTVDPEDSTVIT